MKRQELEHVVRAAAGITGEKALAGSSGQKARSRKALHRAARHEDVGKPEICRAIAAR